MMQRKCSITLRVQDEETQIREHGQVDQETAEPQELGGGEQRERKKGGGEEKEKNLIIYRSNVAQFNKLNLSLITIIYCSSYTPQYQQKNTSFSSLRTDEPTYPLTQCHIPEDSNPFLLSCIPKQKYRMYISDNKFHNDMTLSPDRDS